MLASVSLWVRGKAPGKGRRGTTRRKSRPGPVVPWACPALCVLALRPPRPSSAPAIPKGTAASSQERARYQYSYPPFVLSYQHPVPRVDRPFELTTTLSGLQVLRRLPTLEPDFTS